jgi:hypothetical protein
MIFYFRKLIVLSIKDEFEDLIKPKFEKQICDQILQSLASSPKIVKISLFFTLFFYSFLYLIFGYKFLIDPRRKLISKLNLLPVFSEYKSLIRGVGLPILVTSYLSETT